MLRSLRFKSRDRCVHLEILIQIGVKFTYMLNRMNFMKAYSVVEKETDGSKKIIFSTDDISSAYRKAIGEFRKIYGGKKNLWVSLSAFDREVIVCGFEKFYKKIQRDYPNSPSVICNK